VTPPLHDLVELMGRGRGPLLVRRGAPRRARRRAPGRAQRPRRGGLRRPLRGAGRPRRVGGAWGFAATRDTSRDGAERALARALAVAEAQPTAAGRPRVVEPAARGHWAGPCIVDPFSLSLEYKLELLTTAELALRVDPRLVRTEAGSVATRIEQAFASTDGARARRCARSAAAG
jgi:TldD protein